jgi:hypothetical protein
MPCKGPGGWWKRVKDPKARAKARRYFYAQRGKDLAGMKKTATEARRLYKREHGSERKRLARITREERKGARA